MDYLLDWFPKLGSYQAVNNNSLNNLDGAYNRILELFVRDLNQPIVLSIRTYLIPCLLLHIRVSKGKVAREIID